MNNNQRSIPSTRSRPAAIGFLSSVILGLLLAFTTPARSQDAPFSAPGVLCDVTRLISITGFPTVSVSGISDRYNDPADPGNVNGNNGLPYTVGDVSTWPVFSGRGPNIQGVVYFSAFPTLLAPLAFADARYGRGTGVVLPDGTSPVVVGYTVRHNTGLTYEASAWVYPPAPPVLAAPNMLDLGVIPGGGGSSRAYGETLMSQDAAAQSQIIAVGSATALQPIVGGYQTRVEKAVYWRIDPAMNDAAPNVLPSLPGGRDAFAYAAASKQLKNDIVGESTGTLTGFRPSRWPTLWVLPNVPTPAAGAAPAPDATWNLCDADNLTAALPGILGADTLSGGVAYSVAAFRDMAGDPDLAEVVVGSLSVVSGKPKRLKNRATVWTSSFAAGAAKFTAATLPEPPGDAGSTVVDSIARGANSSQTVVGTVLYTKGGVRFRRGFISKIAGGVRSWATALPNDARFSAITSIRAINNDGDMVGTAQLKNSTIELDVLLK